jgi:amidase
VQPPSSAELARIAGTYGIELAGSELEQFTALAAQSFGAHDRLDELAEPQLPVRYPRIDTGYRPTGADNPGNGWAWRCSIPGAETGPLAGVRVAVKDSICVAGIPLLNGSSIMEGFIPREDATVVTRLLDAGAEIVGKTAVPAFCFEGGNFTTYPRPEPVNPHDSSRMPGGSSSGSAIVVANGQADMALGGDQSGSIRVPASWSGVVGHKPTYGLVPYTGAMPIEHTIDHVGPLARTVTDCARMLEVLAGDDGLDPRSRGSVPREYVKGLDSGIDGLRIGVLTEGFGWPDLSEPDVDALVRSAAASLEGAGGRVDEVSVPMHRDGRAIWFGIITEGVLDVVLRGDGMGTNWKGHYSTDVVDFYGRAWRARANEFPVTVKLTMLLGHYVAERYGHHYYAKAQNLSRVLAAHYDAALRDFDVLVMPTTPMKAPLRPGYDADVTEVMGGALAMNQNSAPFNITSHPALSVPCGFSDGLPVGMMIVGRKFEDATVLRVGHAFERSGFGMAA